MEAFRTGFDSQLAELRRDVLEMGGLVEQMIARSVEVLKSRDAAGARRLIAEDRQINRRRYEIEEQALVLLATQQPMASDLRTIAAIIHIAGELERIADHAKGNAKISLLLGSEPLSRPLPEVTELAERVRSMLRLSLDAFVAGDAEGAVAVAKTDDELDVLYNHLYQALIGAVAADPSSLRREMHLLWVAHNLERISDRVTNICERIVFMVTGRVEELEGEVEGISLGEAEAEKD